MFVHELSYLCVINLFILCFQVTKFLIVHYSNCLFYYNRIIDFHVCSEIYTYKGILKSSAEVEREYKIFCRALVRHTQTSAGAAASLSTAESSLWHHSSCECVLPPSRFLLFQYNYEFALVPCKQEKSSA